MGKKKEKTFSLRIFANEGPITKSVNSYVDRVVTAYGVKDGCLVYQLAKDGSKTIIPLQNVGAFKVLP